MFVFCCSCKSAGDIKSRVSLIVPSVLSSFVADLFSSTLDTSWREWESLETTFILSQLCLCVRLLWFIHTASSVSSTTEQKLRGLLDVREPHNYVIHHTSSSPDKHKSCNLITNFDSRPCLLYIWERLQSRSELLKLFWRYVDSFK
jgi:hypothetical protein